MYFVYKLNLIYEVPYCKLSLINPGLSLHIFARGFRGACKQSWAGAYYTSFRRKLPNFIKLNWVIPENIHTIPRSASWNSEGEGGFLGLEFGRRGGVMQFGIPKAWGGCLSSDFSEFPEERLRKLRLKSLTC